MTYQKKIDEMVGKHVADYQLGLTLARKLKGKVDSSAMPYGYPLRVYRPMHILNLPHIQHFIAKTGGKLSNGVPRVLSADIVGDYLLGIYNPKTS